MLRNIIVLFAALLLAAPSAIAQDVSPPKIAVVDIDRILGHIDGFLLKLGALGDQFVEEFAAFYDAEEYHQNFKKNNPERYNAYRTGSGRD